MAFKKKDFFSAHFKLKVVGDSMLIAHLAYYKMHEYFLWTLIVVTFIKYYVDSFSYERLFFFKQKV